MKNTTYTHLCAYLAQHDISAPDGLSAALGHLPDEAAQPFSENQMIERIEIIKLLARASQAENEQAHKASARVVKKCDALLDFIHNAGAAALDLGADPLERRTAIEQLNTLANQLGASVRRNFNASDVHLSEQLYLHAASGLTDGLSQQAHALHLTRIPTLNVLPGGRELDDVSLSEKQKGLPEGISKLWEDVDGVQLSSPTKIFLDQHCTTINKTPRNKTLAQDVPLNKFDQSLRRVEATQHLLKRLYDKYRIEFPPESAAEKRMDDSLEALRCTASLMRQPTLQLIRKPYCPEAEMFSMRTQIALQGTRSGPMQNSIGAELLQAVQSECNSTELWNALQKQIMQNLEAVQSGLSIDAMHLPEQKRPNLNHSVIEDVLNLAGANLSRAIDEVAVSRPAINRERAGIAR